MTRDWESAERLAGTGFYPDEYGILPTSRRRYQSLKPRLADRLREVIISREVDGHDFYFLKPTSSSAIWGEKPEMGIAQRGVEYPNKNNSKRVRANVRVSPSDYLRLQSAVFANNGEPQSVDETLKWVGQTIEGQPEYFTDMVDNLKGGDEALPMPHTELNRHGVPISQEGRHRAVAAHIAGYDFINARLFMSGNREDTSKTVGDIPPEFAITAYINQELVPLYEEATKG